MIMQSNGSKQGRRAPRRRGRKQLVVDPRERGPPQFMSTVQSSHKFRFTAAAASSVIITRAQLLNLISMATTTTNQYRVIAAIKLNRVEAWVNPPVLGAASSQVALEWMGTYAPTNTVADSSMGVSPAHIRTKPPKESSASWWSLSGTNESTELFAFTFSIGAIIDIDVSINFVESEGATAAENGTAAASTVGRVYYNYLDGFATKRLAPVGGVTVLP